MGSPNWQRCVLTVLALVFWASGNAFAARLEMAAVTVQDTFTTPNATRVSFIETFDVVPIVVSLATTQGGDPALLRITNVTRFGFDIVQTEPNANDGPHVAMDTAYLAVEPGVHTLPGGAQLIAMSRDTISTVSGINGQSWDNTSFPVAFGSRPALVTALQTARNESATPPSSSSIPLLGVAVRNLTATGFDFALERAESTAGVVSAAETIGMIAVADTTTTTLIDTSGNSALFQARVTPNNIEGFSNGCFNNTYNASFSTVPLTVASMVTRNGGNGGWLRRCALAAGSIGLTVDEDIDNDPERNHINETAAVIAASRAFHINLGVGLSIAKTIEVDRDPVSGDTNPFAIPGAVVRYSIDVRNAGSGSPDGNSLTVVDSIPSQLSLCVAMQCFSGGPVTFDDSASPIPTGLTIAGIEYSDDDGASFGYVPTGDANGFDAAVTDVRITLAGTLPGIGIAGEPTFSLALAARVN
ncbi:MAG: hypothetical protein AAFX44_05235 [Pseudomonadota bacterium]